MGLESRTSTSRVRRTISWATSGAKFATVKLFGASQIQTVYFVWTRPFYFCIAFWLSLCIVCVNILWFFWSTRCLFVSQTVRPFGFCGKCRIHYILTPSSILISISLKGTKYFHILLDIYFFYTPFASKLFLFSGKCLIFINMCIPKQVPVHVIIIAISCSLVSFIYF